jgi:hypothetical protein
MLRNKFSSVTVTNISCGGRKTVCYEKWLLTILFLVTRTDIRVEQTAANKEMWYHANLSQNVTFSFFSTTYVVTMPLVI